MADKIYIGGLMRCCIETLLERTDPGTEGEIQPCKYCSSSSIFEGDGWRWIAPPDSWFAQRSAEGAHINESEIAP